jgi:lambda family phage tail tape measure protein
MALNLDAALKITASVAGENNIRRFQNSLQGLEGRIKNTSMAADLLVSGIKGLAAAAVTGGVLGLAKSAIDLADNMRDLSQRTGVSIQTLGQFKVAAELSGSTIEGVAKGLNFLNKNMVAAATGGKDAAAAFQTIGVSIKDAEGNLRTADQVFLDVADRFATLRDGPEKAAIAMRIFGKAGADLIPILNLGSQEIQRFGLNISQDFADKADAFNDQLGLAGAQVTNLSIQIGSALLPVVNSLLAGLSGAVTQIGKWIEGLQTAYKENAAFKTSIDVLIGAFTALATVQVFSTFIAGAKAAILITGTLIKALKGLTAANLLAGAAGFLKSKPGLIAALVGGLGVGIDAAFNQGKIVSGITRGISGALDQAFGAFGAMVPSVPNIPTRQGGVLDVSGLDTGTANKVKKAKEIQEITAEELQLSKLLNKAKIDGNTLQQAELEYGLSLLDIDKQKIGVRQRQKLEADAATKLLQAEIDYAKQLGSAIAQDFLKRQELQNNYNNTVEDLRIKAGLITGEELKRLEIDRELEAIMERIPGLTDEQIAKLKQLIQASKDVKDSFGDTFGASLKEYYQQLTNFGAQVADSVKGAFQGLEDQLTSFVTTGKANFADLANSIIQDIARIAIRQAIIAPLVKGVGGIFGLKFADGGIFAQNGIQKFARGGIVDKPTLFPFANGTGLMGEAGPEAILPLRRGRDGRLGVEAGGGAGGINVTVNVDATGTKAQGDDGRAGQFARAISEAVKNEIVTQKRPGGLLA